MFFLLNYVIWRIQRVIKAVVRLGLVDFDFTERLELCCQIIVFETGAQFANGLIFFVDFVVAREQVASVDACAFSRAQIAADHDQV